MPAAPGCAVPQSGMRHSARAAWPAEALGKKKPGCGAAGLRGWTGGRRPEGRRTRYAE
jgi:hypothetical protein